MSNFDPGDSLGARSPTEIAAYLTEIGDLVAAQQFAGASAGGQNLLSIKKPYNHTGMVLGFLAPNSTTAFAVDVMPINQVAADHALVGRQIKITLDKFHVANYPGLGTHKILCEFAGKNQLSKAAEELKFALRFEAGDNGEAAISGSPIFMGLTIGADGISFKGRTVNVCSLGDEVLLAALDTPAFKSGLALLNAAQPALKPLSALATATVQLILQRKKNVQVHNFDLGLDFAAGVSSARLRLGSYVVVQSDDSSQWDWGKYTWSGAGMALQDRADPSTPIPFNYMVFGVAASADKLTSK